MVTHNMEQFPTLFDTAAKIQTEHRKAELLKREEEEQERQYFEGLLIRLCGNRHV